MTLNASRAPRSTWGEQDGQAAACQSAWWPGHPGWDLYRVGCRTSGSVGYRKLLGTRNQSFPLVTFVGSCEYVCCFTGKAKDSEALVRPKDGISGRQETEQTNHLVPRMGMVKRFDPRQPACNEGRLASITVQPLMQMKNCVSTNHRGGASHQAWGKVSPGIHGGL